MSRSARCATPHRSWAVLLAAVVGAGVLVACGIQPDGAPRDIGEDRSLGANAVAAGAQATGTSRIYLVTPNEPDATRQLRSVQRDVQPGPSPLLDVLFEGPNSAELGEGIITALPDGLDLLSTRSVGDLLVVDVTDEITDLSGDVLILAVAQIVHTASELDGVSEVRLRVNGEDQSWPRGDGESLPGPLSPYDYPSLVETAQPAYPAVP